MTVSKSEYFANQSVRSLLLLRPDNLGDLVLFSGALKHIRSHFSRARITLCVKRNVLNYVELCPHVDEILCWEDLVGDLALSPTLDWLPDIRGKWRLERTLRRVTGQMLRWKYKSDLILLPVRSPTSGEYGMHAIVNRLPAKQKLGIAGDCSNQTQEADEAAVGSYTQRLHLSQEKHRDHELHITREFLRFVGVEVGLDVLWPCHWTSISEEAWAREHIPACGEEIQIALCPGVTSFLGKLYPAQKIAASFSLIPEVRFNVVLFGSRDEAKVCEDAERALLGFNNITTVTNFCGQTTIRELVEGLKKCDIVLSQDSAALHIAVALRKPTVGIIGGGHYGRFYPWGDGDINRVAHNPMDCYWCNWICKFEEIRCINEISPERIASELHHLIRLLPKNKLRNRVHELS